MKPILVLTLITAALACNNPRRMAGWIIVPGSEHIDSSYIDGRMETFGRADARINMVCVDSLLAAEAAKTAAVVKAKKDSVAARAKKP